MLFLNKEHFFPVMFFEEDINLMTGAALAMSNMTMKAQMRK
jgi:hypothetical protein